ncbi:MAG: hypothetical protein JWQ30_294 [Sediminibacterium sp.]|nr:hypothetical protein [Sediminibacterium sp.]
MTVITLVVSIIALSISFLTFWLTRIKRGSLKMTRPTVIFFGPDGRGKDHKKVFIRTLLYSTSEQGKYIQNMFIRLQRDESIQNFNIWVYDNNGLVRGSRLFVNKTGVSFNCKIRSQRSTHSGLMVSHFSIDRFFATFVAAADDLHRYNRQEWEIR